MYIARTNFVHGGLGSVTKGDPFEKNKITDDLYEMGYLVLAESSDSVPNNADKKPAGSANYDTKVLKQKPKGKKAK